jgi:hypothetical protein
VHAVLAGGAGAVGTVAAVGETKIRSIESTSIL